MEQVVIEDKGYKKAPPVLLISFLVALLLVGFGYAEYRRADVDLYPVSVATTELNKALSVEDMSSSDLTRISLAVQDADVALRSYNAIFPIETIIKYDRKHALNEALKSFNQRMRDEE